MRDESQMGRNTPPDEGPRVPHPFESGADLLQRAADAGLSIAGVMGANELARMDAVYRQSLACEHGFWDMAFGRVGEEG